MIIWIVALVVVALAAVTGWNRGAVRAGISLAGLLVAAMLAMPLSGIFKPILGFLWFKHPYSLVFAAPITAFIVVLVAFKIGAQQVYSKIDYWLKYRATEVQKFTFDRMNSRVGACIGVVNGIIYFVALMVPFYIASYITLQMPLGDGTPFTIKTVNAIGKDLRAAKLGNVVAGFDPAPAAYYEASDIVGLVLNNYPLQNRISRYPTLLSLGERKEFQDIGADMEIQRMFAESAPLSDILKNDKIQAVVTNREIALEVQKMLSLEELKDLKQFLKTGISPKYSDERLYGMWVLSINATSAELKKKNPQITSRDLMRFKAQLYNTYPIAELVVTTDSKAVLKVADATATPPIPQPSLRGTWSKAETGYEFQMGGGSEGPTWKGTVIGDQLYVTTADGQMTLVFNRYL